MNNETGKTGFNQAATSKFLSILQAQESDDDTLEVNLHPEKSRWELSDDEDEVPEPKPTPKAPMAEAKPAAHPTPISQNNAKPAIDVDSNKNDSSEDSGRKIKKKKKRRHTSDSDEADHLLRKKKKKEKRKRESKKGKSDEDDTRKQLQKIVLQRLENGDKDPKLIEMAMQLMGSDKVKQAPVSFLFIY